MFEPMNPIEAQDHAPLPIPETVELEEQAQTQQPQQQSSKDAETNIARMRENMKRMEHERNEAIREAQELKQKYTHPKEDSFAIAPDDLVEGKHLNHYNRKIKELEEKVTRYEQQTTMTSAESRLRNQYEDFDRVVSQENITTLREVYPELAASLNSNNDLYTKAASAYTIIKKLGIYKEDVYKNDREHATTNATKPRPLTSVSPQQGESPLSRANAFAQGLTPELKEQLRREMYEARRKN